MLNNTTVNQAWINSLDNRRMGVNERVFKDKTIQIEFNANTQTNEIEVTTTTIRNSFRGIGGKFTTLEGYGKLLSQKFGQGIKVKS
tara:strand:- start:22 stop:279 length:258 start_codon:yes stop_codon:yes gene_type:complete